MITNFYETPEYLNFAKVHTRIQQHGGNTLKNMESYIDRFVLAMKICEELYNNIGYKASIYKWAPSPELSRPIDYNGSKVVENSILKEKIAIHSDGSMTCCKSGFWLDQGSVKKLMESTPGNINELFQILKVFPGSKIIED